MNFKQPYLIQRATITDDPTRKGIDTLLNFDYMGASEFEWGALPKALKRIRENLSKFGFIQSDIDGVFSVEKKTTLKGYAGEWLVPKITKCKFLFFGETQMLESKEFKDSFSKLLKNEIRLKNYIGLAGNQENSKLRSVFPEKIGKYESNSVRTSRWEGFKKKGYVYPDYDKFNAWWDIENNWFAYLVPDTEVESFKQKWEVAVKGE